MDGWKVIHEVKKSRKIEPASIWQLKYYLYYLEKRGVDNLKGMLDYPKLKKRKRVELSDSDQEKIEDILEAIKQILESGIPERIDSSICKKCAYYELCYI
jgi:CRISPR-associated exonuclease Cas4